MRCANPADGHALIIDPLADCLTLRVTRMSASDRLAAWLVTGPVGRLVAFACDLAVALTRGLINKLSRR
jgi:hypothetical protein